MNKLLWKPSEKLIEDANITNFISEVNSHHNLNLKDYHDLYKWSIDNIALFWEEVWKFCQIISSSPYTTVVENLEDFPPKTVWFKDAKLNFTENLLRYKDNQIAILFKKETSQTEEISYKQLNNAVAKLSTNLRSSGVKAGDRIAGYMPNIPQTVIAMLASTSLGATWSSCGAELGADAALDRLGQIEPKIIFSVDAYPYKGKHFDLLKKLNQVVQGIPSVEKVVIYKYIDENADISAISNSIDFNKLLISDQIKYQFKQLPFSHPQYIMFSSGTTGKPKCMVQSSGGVLINHLKELVLHTDLKRSDKLMYLASPSWMMWNWLVSGLAVGATIVLFDGNPIYPNWGNLWQFISEYGITIFGCSASYLHFIKSQNAKPGTKFDLSKLRQISQTGSSLSPEGFEFVYSEIKEDLHFNSISGGTDINGCFAAGSPTLPVYSGELQAIALGMRVKSYDQNAKPVNNDQGELVCELPSPSMPIYFWNDDNDKKYSNAYFNYFQNKRVWRHGDFVKINESTGGVTFYGRSDAVLKPSGVRIGTSEIYSIVESFPEIDDSLAIGQKWKDDQRILLFIQLAKNYELNKVLINKIKTELRSKASPRHVPQKIISVEDIPYTFSGKKVESAVTNIIHDRKVTNKGALRNPESLDIYVNLKESLFKD